MLVRTFPSRLSLRTVVSVTGLTAAIGATPAAAQVTQPDSSSKAPTPLIWPKNAYLEAQRQPPPPRVTLDVHDSTIAYVVEELSRRTGIPVRYPEADSHFVQRIHLSVVNTPLLDALRLALRGTGFQAVFTDNTESVVAIQPATGPERVPELVAVESEEPPLAAIPIVRDSVRTRPRIISFPDSLPKSGAAMLAGVVTTATGQQRQLELGTRIETLNADSVVQTAPIMSVTDLLEGRVPGMVVQRTSGTPGDPARIRVRGFGSIAQYNDPIIVVDGARMYSRQSDKRNLNAGGFINYAGERTSQYATPSPLDQIEPSTIERIEVLKGPSASAMYGSDAANGVIVITTKTGRPGPTRWTVAAEQGLAYMPGDWFDARHTPFSRGKNSALNLTLSGGNSAIQYAYTAGIRNQLGVLKLPEVEQERYFEKNGTHAPGWMRQPDHLDAIGGNGQVNIQVNERVNLALTNLMNSQTQKRSSMSNGLNGALAELQRRFSGEPLPPDSALLTNYYERVSSQSRNFLLSMQVQYRPVDEIPINATFGLGRLMREDKNIVARGVFQSPDSTGFYGSGDGTAIERTVSVNTVVPLLDIFSVGLGVNAQHGSVSDLRGSFRNIPLGVTTPSSGDVIEFTAPENSWRLFGWFVEPKIMVSPRLFITPGLRIDNTALSGQRARYAAYPKLSVSWITSDEPYYSTLPLSGLFSTFRLRSAIGYAGVPPTADDQFERLRLQAVSNASGRQNNNILSLPENPLERSMEIEGGFDAEMWHGRLRMDVTYYRKNRNNALINNSLASSLPDFRATRRFGDLRYTGIEFGLDAQLLERDAFRWQGGVTINRNTSTLLRIHRGPQFKVEVAPWVNVSTFPMEAKNPNYHMTFNSGLTFFNGKLGVFTSFTYAGGLIQRNLTDGPIFTDTTTIDDVNYGNQETVNAFRWQSLSVNYDIPMAVVRLLRVGGVTVALQGANLGLWSNYSGIDPNVSALVTGNATFDTGQVPQPRTWQLRVTVRR